MMCFFSDENIHECLWIYCMVGDDQNVITWVEREIFEDHVKHVVQLLLAILLNLSEESVSFILKNSI